MRAETHMKRIMVITSNTRQASFRLLMEALFPLLAVRGFEMDVKVRSKNWFMRRSMLREARSYHAVILLRKLLDPSDARLLCRHARRLIYALDDAVMYHANPVGRYAQWRTTRRFEATARIADHVVAGNEYLAAMFRQRGRPVTVLPTCLDPTHYRVKQHAETSPINLVWIGSKSTLPYVERHVEAIRLAATRVPLKLITIADRTLEYAGFEIEHEPWSYEGEADALARGDIGIAPTPCDRWTLGKCGFKLIQYMAAGLPTIASPVGANREIVRVGETGLLAETPHQWADAIVQLAHDVELRRRMGRAARERAEREYSLTRAADTWAKLLAD
jgi:glycosyltransferase involved in cell wall biosynthesis